MKTGSDPMKTGAETMKTSGDMKPEILASYAKIAAALAADDFATAKTAAKEVGSHAGMSSGFKTIAPLANAVANAASIAESRSAFKALSAAVEPLAMGQAGYFVMHCPMANADWVQASKDIKNPYYGKMMIDCGELKSPR